MDGGRGLWGAAANTRPSTRGGLSLAGSSAVLLHPAGSSTVSSYDFRPSRSANYQSPPFPAPLSRGSRHRENGVSLLPTEAPPYGCMSQCVLFLYRALQSHTPESPGLMAFAGRLPVSCPTSCRMMGGGPAAAVWAQLPLGFPVPPWETWAARRTLLPVSRRGGCLRAHAAPLQGVTGLGVLTVQGTSRAAAVLRSEAPGVSCSLPAGPLQGPEPQGWVLRQHYCSKA